MTWARYDKQWTDLSLRELENFARWMNELIGYHPTVIGGWAVYIYNPHGLGSRDIDVILPSWEVKGRVADLYLRNNGYILREKAFGLAEWVKYLEPGNETSETYLDICTLQDKNLVHGMDIELPWTIATKNQRAVKVADFDLYIPAPEPLLLLKAKAAWDRAYDIRSGMGSDFLRDKVRKDRFDILSLLANAEVTLDTVSSMAEEYGLSELLRDVIDKALNDESVIHHPGIVDIKKAVTSGRELIRE